MAENPLTSLYDPFNLMLSVRIGLILLRSLLEWIRYTVLNPCCSSCLFHKEAVNIKGARFDEWFQSIYILSKITMLNTGLFALSHCIIYILL
jgi:hypothetical protein